MKQNIKRFIRFLIPHRLLVIFCAGFFLALSIIFKIDANYTEELFNQLGKHILEEATLNHDNVEQTVVRAMNVTYSMQEDNRKNLFQ